MKIAPIDIAHKSFGRKMWGYDPEEVTEFLRSVADELESVVREVNSLKEKVREKDLAILEYRERDKVLKETITTAQKMSEKISQEAEKEAKLVLDDARHKAEIIVHDARSSLKRQYQEISELKRARIQFETSLRAMIKAHLDILNDQDRFLNYTNKEIPKQQQEAT